MYQQLVIDSLIKKLDIKTPYKKIMENTDLNDEERANELFHIIHNKYKELYRKKHQWYKKNKDHKPYLNNYMYDDGVIKKNKYWALAQRGFRDEVLDILWDGEHNLVWLHLEQDKKCFDVTSKYKCKTFQTDPKFQNEIDKCILTRQQINILWDISWRNICGFKQTRHNFKIFCIVVKEFLRMKDNKEINSHFTFCNYLLELKTKGELSNVK